MGKGEEWPSHGAASGGEISPRMRQVAASSASSLAAVTVPVWRMTSNGAAQSVPDAFLLEQVRRPHPTDTRSGPLLRRRRLLKAGFWAGTGMLAAGILASLADYVNLRDFHDFGAVLTVPYDQVPRPGGNPVYYRKGKLWLVNLAPGNGVPKEFQRLAAPSRSGGLLALYEKCPHLGCSIMWSPDFEWGNVKGWFCCRCHFSNFTRGGVRVSGPAPRSLSRFKITAVGPEGVSVDTGRLILGGLDEPQHTVPAGPFA